MNQKDFIENKKEKWENLSSLLDKIKIKGYKSLSSDEVANFAELYREVISDLAYVRTHYNSTELEDYLNDLSGRAHGSLYVSENVKAKGLFNFIARDFPQLVRKNWLVCCISAFLFLSGWVLGHYVTVTYPDSSENVFQQSSNKEQSSDKGTYIPHNPSELSGYIMTNNIRVGISAFAGGVSAGLLTCALLFYNGYTIGGIIAESIPFQGLFRLSALLLPHGVIELLAIFICGGAGLVMGWSIISPGNLARKDSLKSSAATAFKLFAGTLPMFGIAALIEGFVTPSSITSEAKILFAILTAVAMILYLGFAGSLKKEKIVNL
ncbi:MAG: stage II sporulation protein M [Armatimonadota bacterium]